MSPTPQTLSLNAGQEAAADEFFTFLFSEQREMGIDGPGGVGKSFLMSHLIDRIMPRYFDTCSLMGIQPEYEEVVITAMTNKAAEVLAEATQRPVQTLHSFMNLKLVDDYETGVSRVTKTDAWRVHQNKIIFIDECSMMDEKVYAYLSEGTHKCKIVYVGDDKQLRPISGRNPVYAGHIPFYTLTQQMRTGIPEIQALHAQLRETVATGVFNPIQVVPGIIDHLDNDQMMAQLAIDFAGQTTESRILAYTNKRVVLYNDYIRQQRNLPPEYIDGEMLVNSTAVRLKNAMLSVEAEVEIISMGPVYNVMLEDDVSLLVRDAVLRTRSGAIHNDVPLPVDRAHYAALLSYYSKNKIWRLYYKLKNEFPDLRQRDAATAYKAQGSTYQSAFIDLSDISTCRNPDQAARLLYVAASRPRSRIILFGTLSDKYGGLLH